MDARAFSFLDVKLSRSGENDDCSMVVIVVVEIVVFVVIVVVVVVVVVVVAAASSSSCIVRQACGSCGAARAAWRIPFAVHLK